MDLEDGLLRELEGARDAAEFLGRLVRAAAARTRCPGGAAYLADGAGYRLVATSGRPPALPASLPAPPPTARNARNVHLPGDRPDRPPAFLRLEWDGPQIHDPEAVDALEAACVAAAEMLARLPS